MRNERRGEVFRHVHALFSMGRVAGLTDGELLDRFVKRDGETAELAFSLLVERHGPMVLSVCRRVLADPHDAQDAFQATFLILVRKARAIRNQASVGSWLYGVAYRVSATARATAAQRRTRCLGVDDELPDVDELGSHDRRELNTLLHEELLRLPERYRASLVLCYLEGLTHEQAAVRLGRPLTTVRTWLARGREELRGRLSRRGVTLSAGLLATALSAHTRASISPALVESTVKSVLAFWETRALTAEIVSASVASLTTGVLRTMLISKLKLVMSMVGALGILATSAGVFAYQGPGPKAEQSFQEALGIKKVAPPLSGEERASVADQYLEKTSREVDASISALQVEIEELTARLERARSSLRRMESLKEALSGKGEARGPRHERTIGGVPQSTPRQSGSVKETQGPSVETRNSQSAAMGDNSATSPASLTGSPGVSTNVPDGNSSNATPARDSTAGPASERITQRERLRLLDISIEQLRKQRARLEASKPGEVR